MAIQKTAPNIDYSAIRYMLIGALVVVLLVVAINKMSAN